MSKAHQTRRDLDGDIDMEAADTLTGQMPTGPELIEGMDDPMENPQEPDDHLLENNQEFGGLDSEASSGDENEEGLSDSDEDEDEQDDDDDGVALDRGREVSPSDIPLIGANSKAQSVASFPSTSMTADPALHPEKPTPYTFDAGHLLVMDPNPVAVTAGMDHREAEAILTSTARDAAQSLLNHLLTTCPIHTTGQSAGSGVTMTLPTPIYHLPREKAVPKPKEDTKWERFAKKKGIGKYNKAAIKGQEGEGRAGKLVFDQATGEWVPRYGYKGKNKQMDNQWLVEVDEKEEKKKIAGSGANGIDPRSMNRAARKEKIKRNERAQRANERKGRKGTSAG